MAASWGPTEQDLTNTVLSECEPAWDERIEISVNFMGNDESGSEDGDDEVANEEEEESAAFMEEMELGLEADAYQGPDQIDNTLLISQDFSFDYDLLSPPSAFPHGHSTSARKRQRTSEDTY